VFFGLIAFVGLVLVGCGAVIVVSYMLLLPLQVGLKPKGPNRYGPASPTGGIAEAVAGGFRRAFDFSGRANRIDFWVFAILISALCFAAFVAFVVAAFIWKADNWPWIALPLAVIPVLAVPSLSVAVRRLHDVNRSGWWLLVLCVAGILTLLYWFIQPPQSDAEDKAAVFT